MQTLMIMPLEQQDAQSSGYDQNGWMSVHSSSSTSPQTAVSPMQELSSFGYHTPNPMPLEPTYTMHRPSPFAASQPQMLPPLMTAHNGLWPSMLVSQPPPSCHTPVQTSGSLQTPLSASTASDATPTSAKTNTSRRKLTDDERRQMCIEAEQNPSMKQTQIGAKFNVERSTVSKTLRQRERYMNPQPKEESTTPRVKKPKAKLPDFERTLTKWVKNQQIKGTPITDEGLRKQVEVFSTERSDQAVVSSAAWLEAFKRKNHLVVSQRADGELILIDSSTTSLSHPLAAESSTSSTGLVSPTRSPVDELRVKREGTHEFLDVDTGKDSYGHSVSMDHDLEEPTLENLQSSLSPKIAQEDRDRLSMMEAMPDTGGGSNRQSSQKISHIPDISVGSRPSSTTGRAPSLPVRSLSSTCDSGLAGIDPRQMMKSHNSVSDRHYPKQARFSPMPLPPLPKSADTSPVSHPASPAEDDNIRALYDIKALLEKHPNVAEPDDYLAIGKLMEKVKLLRSSSNTLLPGGMHPMDIMNSPCISKKRTILGISN